MALIFIQELHIIKTRKECINYKQAKLCGMQFQEKEKKKEEEGKKKEVPRAVLAHVPRRSIEGGKGKKKKKKSKRRKKKRGRRKKYLASSSLTCRRCPRIAHESSPPLLAGDFSPARGDRMSPRSGRKIEVTDDAERLAAKLRRVSVADVVERMEVCTVPFSIHGNQISTIYKLKMTLYPSELYPSFSELTLEDCREVLETTFVEAMEDAIAKHVDTIFKISDIKVVSGKEENDFEEGVDEDESRNKSNTVEENADGGDEDDESGDDQGTYSKKRKQQANDEVEYDDGIEKESFVAAGEHDEETQSGFESEIDHVEAEEDYLMGGGSPGFDMDLATPESPSKAESTPMSEDDKKMSKSVEKGKKESVEKGKKETKLKAKKPKSNKKKIRRTIYVMAEGLKFEVHYIFRINIRHLSLIADFMTFHGGYRPMNRVGMGDFNTSPFGKMTFETATKFIVESAFHGEVDTLESPSASVSLGQPVKMGTGCFDLMQNLQL
ncbi:hypothetical protein BHM03_00008372 [Ensete ventricosum]|nr:hypothetical protein BHM03_00008372 [Ensete ventricosum]